MPMKVLLPAKVPGKRRRSEVFPVVPDITHMPPRDIADLRIVRLVPNNPRLPGSHGAIAWDHITDWMRVGDFLALGRDKNGKLWRHHLTCDLRHKRIALVAMVRQDVAPPG